MTDQAAGFIWGIRAGMPSKVLTPVAVLGRNLFLVVPAPLWSLYTFVTDFHSSLFRSTRLFKPRNRYVGNAPLAHKAYHCWRDRPTVLPERGCHPNKYLWTLARASSHLPVGRAGGPRGLRAAWGGQRPSPESRGGALFETSTPARLRSWTPPDSPHKPRVKREREAGCPVVPPLTARSPPGAARAAQHLPAIPR